MEFDGRCTDVSVDAAFRRAPLVLLDDKTGQAVMGKRCAEPQAPPCSCIPEVPASFAAGDLEGVGRGLYARWPSGAKRYAITALANISDVRVIVGPT